MIETKVYEVLRVLDGMTNSDAHVVLRKCACLVNDLSFLKVDDKKEVSRNAGGITAER